MPVAWTVASAKRRVSLIIADPYTLEEWRTAIRAVLDDPGFLPGFGFLVDRRGCSAPSDVFVNRQIDFLAGEESLRVPHRVALVVRKNDKAAYGMARMLEIRAGLRPTSIEHQIFDSVEAAERWLES